MNAYVRFILTVTLLFPLLLYAQGEQNIWMVNAVPLGGTQTGIDFATNNPQLLHLGLSPYNFPGRVNASNAVCNAAGQPLFFTNGRTVYEHTGQVMQNGVDLIYPRGGTGYSMPPVIMSVPGQSDRYAIFTHHNGGLFYTLVDMTANGGRGAVTPQYKNVPLNSFAGRNGITMNAKTVAIQGCGSNWLLYRSRYASEFRAFAVTADGVQSDPVISEVGLLPVSDYEGNVYQGVLKASPDGRKLAIVAKGAIELFDFDRCSGQVTNSILLAADGDYYYGLCFSPDNSKLYATTFEWPGKVYQFDLSPSAPAAITASKTLVFTSPTYWYFSWIQGWMPQTDPLGDIKAGPDGKIYFGNSYNQSSASWVGPSTLSNRYTGGYHVIHNPNLPGTACNPAANVIWTNSWMGIDMPPDMALPPDQDTVYGYMRPVVACFRDNIELLADTPGRCYLWDDGSDLPVRMVSHPGIYTVQYTDDGCKLHIDSFSVRFMPLPSTAPETYSCPNARQGRAGILPVAGDSTRFHYTWKDAHGNVLKTRESSLGDTLSYITSGVYTVRLTTSDGCDTTLQTRVLPLPLPAAGYRSDTIICKGIPSLFTNTTDAPIWEWHFGDGAATKDRHPQHSYGEAGIYQALLVAENVEGCRDTAVKSIQVKELRLSLTATPDLLNRGEPVLFQTHAPEPYRVTAWLPKSSFSDQSADRQYMAIDTSCIITVAGQSEHGCIDTASVLVITHPHLFLPTAFSPNGDGRNDNFRPAISGGAISIRAFRIFDRWGKEVWSGQGSSAVAGWDGTYNGNPAQVGAYYYTIEAETHTGKVTRQKGDVTLVR